MREINEHFVIEYHFDADDMFAVGEAVSLRNNDIAKLKTLGFDVDELYGAEDIAHGSMFIEVYGRTITDKVLLRRFTKVYLSKETKSKRSK